MELDELKHRAQKTRFPDGRFGNAAAGAQDLTGFIDTMKAEDQRERAWARRVMTFTASAGVFYVFLVALTWFAPPDESPEWHRFILSTFGLVFLSAAFFSRMRSNELARIDYAQPITSFLKSAEQRYKLVNMRDALFGASFVVAYSVTGALGWLSAKHRYFPSMDPGTALIVYGAILTTALVMGLALGVSNWRKRKAPILRQIREMMAALDTQGTESVNEKPS